MKKTDRMSLKSITLPVVDTRSRRSLTHRLTFLFVLLFSLFAATAGATGTDDSGRTSEPNSFKPLEPTLAQARASLKIAKELQDDHYLHLKIGNKLAGKVFDKYIDDLDGQRMYFLKSDIDRFQHYRKELASDLRTAQLGPAFDIYNTYEKRVISRLKYALSMVDQGLGKLNFERNESMRLDRKDQPWPTTEKQLDEIWRKRVKNVVLGMRLSGKSDKAIVKSLRDRYESQLKRAYQAHSEDAFQTYMNALTAVYDPHTAYFSPRASENFNIDMSLSLDGIGAVLQSDNEYTKVVRLIPGGPAARQGQLKPADRIVGVAQGKNGEMVNVVGWRLDDVVSKIRGPQGTIVRLEVIPGGAADDTRTKTIQITRDKVKLEDQAAKAHRITVKQDGNTWHIGVIEIPAFYLDFRAMQEHDPNYKSTTRDVRRLIGKLKQQGIDGLEIDLRNNGGGALPEANELVGLFIGKGPTVQVRDANNEVDVLSNSRPQAFYKGPLMVLVNRLSASASEIFTAAIQDYHRGLVVGSQTFGKGTVQTLLNLNHGQLKITQAKFYRVSGGSTQLKGVTPDISLPTRIDDSEIGEDTFPAALPWDQIPAVPHKVFYDFKPILGKLRERHQKRFEHNPHFQLLKKEIAFLKEQRNRKTVSLDEKKRRQEQDSLEQKQLALANEKRKLDKKKPFASWDAYQKWQQSQVGDNNRQKLDFVAREGGRIIADMVQLDHKTSSIDDVNPRKVSTR